MFHLNKKGMGNFLEDFSFIHNIFDFIVSFYFLFAQSFHCIEFACVLFSY